MSNYAGVIVNNESVQVDKIFTYEVPSELKDIIKVGHRVKIPFGMGNKYIDGFVFSLMDSIEKKIRGLKKIKSIEDEFTLFNEEHIKLIDFIRKIYLCTYLDCIRVIIPTGVTKGISSKKQQSLYISKPLEGKFSQEPYVNIYNIVNENNGMFTRNDLCRKYKFSLSSINTLIKHDYLTIVPQIVERIDSKEYENYERRLLNTEQSNAVKTILEGTRSKYLLHGITGSGKTEVYLTLVEEMLQQGKDSIILVPEITLTPQMVERFKGRLGNNISVFHSKMGDGERYDEWIRIKEGRTKIAIGARSAIFLPFKNLGLIVIDEEHEAAYKSESNPKYDARAVAEFLSKLYDCKVVFGTATPSIETYFRVYKNEIKVINILNRVDNAVLPQSEIVDMREELINNNKSIFSRRLYNSMASSLERGEQIILFLNRRGFSTFISCRQCGFVYKCHQCDISMTYHKEDGLLHCHYCGFKQQVHNKCPKCGSSYIKYFGIGTERVEIEVKKFFPNTKVLRMDLDTTRRKDSYIKIYEDFKKGNAQVLIGTQMIAKGLDFPNVTLVGVLAADLTLNLPDYKSAERTFQLITQVAGRAGRSKKEGKVIIQTYNPDHYSLLSALNYDFSSFYDKEIKIRKSMYYPPFCNILDINLSSLNENLLIRTINELAQNIKAALVNDENIEMLGPCPCPISKIKDMYRWQIILKGDLISKNTNEVKEICYNQLKEVYNEVKLSLDFNPNSLI